MKDRVEGEEPLLINTGRQCRYCGERLSAAVSVCRVCGKYRNRVVERVSQLAALATVVSAVISLALLGLTFLQSKQTSAILQLANAAKNQADQSEKAAKDASLRLADLVTGAEAASRRLGAVEGVLTQVDLASGGEETMHGIPIANMG